MLSNHSLLRVSMVGTVHQVSVANCSSWNRNQLVDRDDRHASILIEWLKCENLNQLLVVASNLSQSSINKRKDLNESCMHTLV